jgi:NADH dehydrogenase
MKIAITGGTGFVGRNFTRRLLADGHEVVLIARGHDQRDPSLHRLPGVTLAKIGLDRVDRLREALAGCEAVAHCAGINREIGLQTYQRVHVEGTRNLTEAAKAAGVRKIIMLSFLRARPDCGSGYHESKWAAEEIIRASGLDYTVIKAGVIYGAGDHMLDHLSHAFYTFPIFGFVGFKPQPIRPTAVEDLVKILHAALVENRLTRATVAMTGPEEMNLEQAVRRVAGVVGKRPLFLRLPIWFHYLLGRICERVMKVPMVSLAQVRILSETLAEPLPPCDVLPDDLLPTKPFSEEQIRKGLPPPGRFTLKDLR